MRKNTSGFTIVELSVVIIIIGILSTIGIMSFSAAQVNSQDTQRSTKVTTIAEALEKYYDNNGEYPSCAAMSQSIDTIASTTLKGIDANSLTSPTSAKGTNSILPSCDDLSDSSSPDNFAYVGDSSAACLTGQACLQFTLEYKEVGTGKVISVNSRRQTEISALGKVTNLVATATSFSQINLIWNSANDASVINYTVQRATDVNFSANLTSVVSVDTIESITGLTPGVKYYFRVAPNSATDQGNWSNTSNATTLSLTTPVATATANSLSQITLSWGAISMATSYTVNISTSSSFTMVVASTTSGTSYAFTGLTPGTTYYLRVQALATGDTSDWSSTKSVAALTLSTPSGLATTVDSDTQITFDWADVPMAITYTAQMSTSSSFTSPTVASGLASSNYTFSGLTAGKTYYFRVEALAPGDTSNWSSTDSDSTTIVKPAAPAISAVISGSNAIGTFSAVTCSAGSTVEYSSQYNVNDVNWSNQTAWSSTPPVITIASNQGQKTAFAGIAHCVGPNITSDQSTTTISSAVRSINQPSTPVYLSPASFTAWIYSVVNYSYSCPTGTWMTNGTFSSYYQANDTWWGPHPFGYNDEWEGRPGTVYAEYYGTYQCKTNYYTSALSPESYNLIPIYS